MRTPFCPQLHAVEPVTAVQTTRPVPALDYPSLDVEMQTKHDWWKHGYCTWALNPHMWLLQDCKLSSHATRALLHIESALAFKPSVDQVTILP